MNGRLVIFGTGAHARKVYHAACGAGYSVAGFADENPAAVSPVAGVPVVAVDSAPLVFVAVGRADVRHRLMQACTVRGAGLVSIVHPNAVVAPDAVLADGVLVAAGAVVESGARLGRGAIIDIGALVDHDCTVAPFAHVRPGQVCGAGTCVDAA